MKKLDSILRIVSYILCCIFIITILFLIIRIPTGKFETSLKIFCTICLCVIEFVFIKSIFLESFYILENYKNRFIKWMAKIYIIAVLTAIASMIFGIEIFTDFMDRIIYRIKISNMKIFRKSKNYFRRISKI